MLSMLEWLCKQLVEAEASGIVGAEKKAHNVIWTNALYKKVRVDGRVISMVVLVACGVNVQGQREVLRVESMMDESKESYPKLFQNLKQRGLETPSLVVSDANQGRIAAIRKNFPGAS